MVSFIVQRQELNKRLGLDDDGNVISSVLATHANVSLNHWIGSDDLDDHTASETTGSSVCQLDVAVCAHLLRKSLIDHYRFAGSPCTDTSSVAEDRWFYEIIMQYHNCIVTF